MGNRIFIVGESEAGVRLDQYLGLKFENVSRSQLQKKISDFILLNNRKTKSAQKLKTGDVISIDEGFLKKAGLVGEKSSLNIIYEDNDLLILNKPAGLLIHPTGRTKSGTLANFLMEKYKDLPTLQGEDRPGIVHRLDKDTSGVLIVTKTESTQQSLINQFKGKKVDKKYIALVYGTMDTLEGFVDKSLRRGALERSKMITAQGGRESLTHWKVLEEFPEVTLLEIRPKTGRTHQIRVHLQDINHPVVGEKLYIEETRKQRIASSKIKHALSQAKRQMLHALEISFKHPVSSEWLKFRAPLPSDFLTVLNLLESTYGEKFR